MLYFLAFYTTNLAVRLLATDKFNEILHTAYGIFIVLTTTVTTFYL